MRDPVPVQCLEVFRLQPRPVAKFDSVIPALRKCTEELIQCRHKIPAMLEVRFVECRELENERPDFLAMRFQRIQEI